MLERDLTPTNLDSERVDKADEPSSGGVDISFSFCFSGQSIKHGPDGPSVEELYHMPMICSVLWGYTSVQCLALLILG